MRKEKRKEQQNKPTENNNNRARLINKKIRKENKKKPPTCRPIPLVEPTKAAEDGRGFDVSTKPTTRKRKIDT